MVLTVLYNRKYRIKELYIKSFERRWHYSSREETNED
nr:MAG TPA: hypothetical protein [Caudoviricetes sp.]